MIGFSSAMFCSCRISTNKCLARSLCNSRATCDTIPECDRQTHRHTTTANTALSIASRGKQETLLLQRNRARHLSVEILQLQNISLENPISWCIICVILRLAVLIQYRNMTDTHIHRQTDRHTTTAYTALSIASRGKNRPYCTAHQLGL